MSSIQEGAVSSKADWERAIEAEELHMTDEQARTFESDVDAVVTEVCRLDRNCNILYSILERCQEPRMAVDVETFVSSLPEMRHALQEPYVYMDLLIDAHGLEAVPLDASGQPVDMEEFDAADDAARDSMIADYRIQTTLAGSLAVKLLSPEARMRAKLEAKPERYSTYLAVLDFCRQPRSLADVKRLFDEDATLNRQTTVDAQPLSCDFYLSELERAGGLVWDGGWVCTPAGEALAESQMAAK